MKSLYLVLLDASLDRKQILDFLSDRTEFGMWFYSMPSSFFIYSSCGPREIADIIRSNFGNRRCFVVQTSGAKYYGYMPNEHWEIVNNLGAEKRYDLTFRGYYVDPADLAACSGVYCVYRCIHNSVAREVSLKELLYIGQAEDIHSRHSNHNKLPVWRSRLRQGETICYSYACVDKQDLLRCEAALIFLNQPVCNDMGKENFYHPDTYISVKGACSLLKSNVVAERTN